MYPFITALNTRLLAVSALFLNRIAQLKHLYLVGRTARNFKPNIDVNERRLRLRSALAHHGTLTAPDEVYQHSRWVAEDLLSRRAQIVIHLPTTQFVHVHPLNGRLSNSGWSPLWVGLIHRVRAIIPSIDNQTPKGRQVRLLA